MITSLGVTNRVEANESQIDAKNKTKKMSKATTTTVLVPSGTKETKIGDFDVLKTIGTGTFARVYLCRPKGI